MPSSGDPFAGSSDLYDVLRRQLTGYQQATPDTIWRRFVSTRGRLTIHPNGIVARLNNRTYSPVLRTAN